MIERKGGYLSSLLLFSVFETTERRGLDRFIVWITHLVFISCTKDSFKRLLFSSNLLLLKTVANLQPKKKLHGNKNSTDVCKINARIPNMVTIRFQFS